MLAAAFPFPVSAQQSRGSFLLVGEVRIGSEPADSGTVVLHRVSPSSPDLTGKVDSVRIAAGGRFEFAVETASDSTVGDVFFASVHFENVLYFGGPVTGPADIDGTYVVQAYRRVGVGPDTRLPVRIRNVFVERAQPGPGWFVTDLFEVENEMEVTLVASEEGATWSHALPPGALGFSVGPSDVAPQAASFSGGRVHVSAPIPPGEHVYLFRYSVPEDNFTLPMEGATGSMELLFSEPAGELSVTGLASLGPMEMDGGTFRRFAGREMAGAVVVVERGATLTDGRSMQFLAALLALALTAAGSILALRSRSRGGSPGARGGRRRELLIAVARLDEARNAGEIADGEYARKRGALLRELKG